MKYKKVAPKVDCRWQGGAPKALRNAAKNKIARRKTEHDFNSQTVASIESFSETDRSGDDVFDPNNKSVIFNISSNSSTESVTDHFDRLFDSLEGYMEVAPEFDCIFIRHRVNQMKDEMFAINEMFKDLMVTGERLKKFLIDRQNTSNVSKNSV